MASVRSQARARWRFGVFAAIAMMCALGAEFAPAAHAAADAEDVRRQAERVVSGGRYQTEMPEGRPPPKPPERESGDFSLGEVAKWALYALLGVVVVFILYTIFNQRIASTRRGARRRPEAREATRTPARSPSAAELADAEAAALAEARRGDFEAAIHLLLLGAIGELRARDARSTARSLTSREILSRVFGGPEEGAARAALRALVAAVEISRFGGRPVDGEAFERCLEAYRALRRALGGGSASVPRVGAQMKTV